jgi:hypothetical protein
MKISLLIPIVVLFLAAFALTACTEEDRDSAIRTEQQYVDLLYALQSGDGEDSREAARELNRSVRDLRQTVYFPLSGEAYDKLRFHVDRAECAYEDARISIDDGDLDQAMVQLDRAVFELAAGDPAGLQDYYVGSIYDFVAAWLEVDYFLRAGPSDYTLAELRTCGKDVYATWRSVRGQRPEYGLYFAAGVDEAVFNGYHATLDGAVTEFRDALRKGNPAEIRDRANLVSEALWDLLLLFGTPPAAPQGMTQ